MMANVVNTIRDVEYPDTEDVGAILRPIDAAHIINYCGARIEDLDLFEKLLSLVGLPEDAVRPLGCHEMRAIQEAVAKADRGEW